MNYKKVFLKTIKLCLAVLVITACSVNTNATTNTPLSIPSTTSIPHQNEVYELSTPVPIPITGQILYQAVEINAENADKIIRLNFQERGLISEIAWSPDGAQIAVSSSTGIFMVDAATFEQTRFNSSISESVAFSPDGAILATTEGNTVLLWDVLTGNVTRTLKGHTEKINSLVFSPDGKRLVSGSQDGTIKIWSIKTGLELNTYQSGGSFLYQLAFSADGKILASVAYDQKIMLWEVSDESELNPLSSFKGTLLAFSNTGEIFATGSDKAPIKLWSISSQQEVTGLPEQTNAVNAMEFSPDGRMLAYTMRETNVQLYDLSENAVLHTFQGHEEMVTHLAFSPDGTKMASASMKTLKIWDVTLGKELNTSGGQTINQSENNLRDLENDWSADGPVTFSPSGEILAAADNENLIRLFDMTTGNLQSQISPNVGMINSIAFSLDGTMLAAGGGIYAPVRAGVQVWNVETLDQVLKVDFSDPVRDVAFSSDGSMLVTAWGESSWGCGKGSIKFLDISTGEMITEYLLKGREVPNSFFSNTGDSTIEDITLSPDGTLMAGINSCGVVGIWNLADQTPVSTLIGANGFGLAIAFNPDGNLLATSGSADTSDNTADLRIFNATTGELLHTLKGHNASVRKLVFSPNGQLLVSTSWDGTVRIWDVMTGNCLRVINVPMVNGIAFSPDGTLLAVTGGGIHLYGVPNPQIVEER